MSRICIKCNAIFTGQNFEKGYLWVEDGIVLGVYGEPCPADECYDFSDSILSPGFIDIHTHGGGGHPFEGSVEDVLAACRFHLSHGTTSICPTLSAAPLPQMVESVARIARAMAHGDYPGHIMGVHMEGPYLSPVQAGAQCPDFITPPTEEEYLPVLEEWGHIITRWSYAPEQDADGRFARHLREHGVVASAGHTNATYGDMTRAMAEGCRLVTHLYSCTSTVTRDHGFRRLGVIETAFLEDDLSVEIICDGKHLPPELIRLIYKIKGPRRVALVTDSLALAGTNLTHGFMQATEFVIEDGVCKLMDRSAFAGSIATADRLLRVAVHEAGLPLADALTMLTATPAAIMGLTPKGTVTPGADADLVVLSPELEVEAVFTHGQRVR